MMDYQQIRKIIYQCYSECPRSVELYHDFSGMNLDQVCDNFIKKMKEFNKLEFIPVFRDEDLVGYFGIVRDFDQPFLWTFFIRPKYRKTDILWEEITKCLKFPFLAGVFESNLPARKYLTRNGGIEKVTKDGAYFIFEE